MRHEAHGMASESLSDAYRAFTTGPALITTATAAGPNVMAAEWTFNVSYDPFLILVSVDPGNRTHDLIREAQEFGVNIVSEDQVAAMGFAGHYSKSDTDKLSSELFETFPAKRIRAPLVRGSLLAAECRLVREIPLGDHTGFLGEVLEFSVDPSRRPLVLHRGSRRLGEKIARQPGIALAATPMEAKAGEEVVVTGEFTSPQQPDGTVSVQLQRADGNVLAAAETSTASGGVFRLRLAIPSSARTDAYRLVARSGEAEGRARIHVR